MSACTNPRCEGGWVKVQASYVEANAPEPDLPEGDTPEDEDNRAKIIEQWQLRRAALADSWYPCKECNQQAFYRWANGHLASDHVRHECPDCQTPAQRRAADRGHREPAPVGANPPPPGYREHF